MIYLPSLYAATLFCIIITTNIFFVSPALIAGMNRKIQDALDVHNQARAQAIGPARPDLIWSPSLASAAQSWADHLASIGVLKHSSGSGMGENLFGIVGKGDSSFAGAAKSWVAEKPLYKGQPIPQGNFESYGHYTQCVWPSTRQVGMAAARSAKGWTYVVGRYSPPGNYVNQTPWS